VRRGRPISKRPSLSKLFVFVSGKGMLFFALIIYQPYPFLKMFSPRKQPKEKSV
jgi:hypothetical protein